MTLLHELSTFKHIICTASVGNVLAVIGNKKIMDNIIAVARTAWTDSCQRMVALIEVIHSNSTSQLAELLIESLKKIGLNNDIFDSGLQPLILPTNGKELMLLTQSVYLYGLFDFFNPRSRSGNSWIPYLDDLNFLLSLSKFGVSLRPSEETQIHSIGELSYEYDRVSTLGPTGFWKLGVALESD